MKYILIAILLLKAPSTFSQELAYKQLTADQGISSNNVYMAYQDSFGFIWIGTDAGVSRFNGYEFERFSMEDGLSDNDIFDIYEDKMNRIWFLTFNGRLSYYKDGEFYNSDNDPFLKNNDMGSYISCIYEDHLGNVWFGSRSNGVACLFKDGKFQRYLYQPAKYDNLNSKVDHIYKIWQNEESEILVLTDVSVENLTKSTSHLHSQSNLILGKENTAHVKVIRLDSEYLLITENGNFNLYDYREFKVKSKFRIDSLNVCIYMHLETDGTIWIGTYDTGSIHLVSILDSDNLITKFLENETITSIMLDKAGNRWFSTINNGIFIKPRKDIYNYRSGKELPDEKVNSITGNNAGEVLLGQESFHTFLRKSTVSSFASNPNFFFTKRLSTIKPTIYKVGYDSDNKSIILSSLGLSIINNTETYYYPNPTRAFAHNKNGTIWIGSSSLIKTSSNRLAETSRPSFKYSQNEYSKEIGEKYLADTTIYSLYWDNYNGKLWIGLGSGLKVFLNNKLIDITTNHSALKSRITDIIGVQGDSSIIVSTYGNGILKLNSNGKIIKHITVKDGLKSNMCRAVFEDENGVIWVASDRGLSRLYFNSDRINILNYDQKDGLLSNKINDVYAFNDSVWIASDLGVSMMKVDKNDFTKTETNKIDVYLTNINVNGVDIPIRSLDDFELELKYYENNIRIDFIGLFPSFEGNIKYKYRLNKGEDNWQYTQNRSVQFSNLSSGKYEFGIQAKYENEEWNNENNHTALTFHISPPFWGKWWFICLMVLALTLILAGSIYSYFKRTELNYKVKDLKLSSLRLQMNPHFIFNILTIVQKFIVEENKKEAYNSLSKFGILIRMILEQSRKDKISLDEEISSLRLYMELEKIRYESLFDFNFSIDPVLDLNSIFIPPMLIQPNIENAIQHGIIPKGGQGFINVDFKKVEKTIQCTVSDNGIGRSASMQMKSIQSFFHKSLALEIINERIELLNKTKGGGYSFRIIDFNGSGSVDISTKAVITFPYKLDR